MTTSARRTIGALALLLAALGFAGCELFAGQEPCTPGSSDECLGGEVCGADGFCRPSDAAASDAGAADGGAG